MELVARNTLRLGKILEWQKVQGRGRGVYLKNLEMGRKKAPRGGRGGKCGAAEGRSSFKPGRQLAGYPPRNKQLLLNSLLIF